MEVEKTFKTKTGFCHILPDKIVLTRDGIIGNVSKLSIGNNISRILIIYGGLAIGLFYLSFDHYKNQRSSEAIILLVLGLFLVYVVVKNFNLSATSVIERKKIIDIKLKKGKVGFTRSYFEVLFENEKGSTKKRLIMLPGSLAGGQTETEKAMQIMMNEGLITKN